LTLKNCVLSNNYAADSGGALDPDGCVLDIMNSKFLNNTATNLGGAIACDESIGTLVGCTIMNNKAVYGGGLSVVDGSRVTINTSTISQNTAVTGGGVLAVQGRFDLSNSTVSGNRTNGGDGLYLNFGGAGLLFYNVQATIVNSTISSNVDQSANPNQITGGGGIHLIASNTVVRNSTIAFNESVGKGGGIFVSNFIGGIANRLLLVSTIVSNNRPAVGNLDVFRNGDANISAVRSLIQNIQPGFITGLNMGNIVDVNPNLQPLRNNGGPTMTHAILGGSPAVDAGSNPDGLTFDQRGADFKRVSGNGVDIGAFEFQG
jgi:predicted outer membrane repeat protein